MNVIDVVLETFVIFQFCFQFCFQGETDCRNRNKRKENYHLGGGCLLVGAPIPGEATVSKDMVWESMKQAGA